MTTSTTPGSVRQAAGFALMGAFVAGVTHGFTGSALVDMGREGSAVRHIVRDAEGRTWFVSIMPIGALVGACLAGAISNRFGRRNGLLAANLLAVVGWTALAFADSFPVLMIGRWLTGLCVGMTAVTVPVYCVEIAELNCRGYFGTLHGTFHTLGIVFSCLLALMFHWETSAMLVVAVAGVTAIGIFYFASESPRWLISRERFNEAEESMKYMYGPMFNASSAIALLSKELGEKRELAFKIAEFFDKGVREPSLIAIFMMMLQQFSGIGSFILYSVTIFKSAGNVSLPAIYCTLIIQITQACFTMICSGFVDHVGRRFLLIVSAMGLTVSMLCFGGYRYIDYIDVDLIVHFHWVPLVCLFFYMASFEIGLGPIPSCLVAELVPLRVRSLVSGVAMSAMYISAFIVSKTFDASSNIMGDFGVYWCYATSNFIALLFILFCVPETRGRSTEEVERYFKRGRVWDDEQERLRLIEMSKASNSKN